MAVTGQQPMDSLQRGGDVLVVEHVKAEAVGGLAQHGVGRGGVQIEAGLVVEPGLREAERQDHDPALRQLAEGVLHQRPAGDHPLQRRRVGVVDQLRVVPEPLAHPEEQLLGRRRRLAGGPVELVLHRLDRELRDDVVLGLGDPLLRRQHDRLHRQVEAKAGQPVLHLPRKARADGHDPVGLGEAEGGGEARLGHLAQPVGGQPPVRPQRRPVAAKVAVRLGRRIAG